MTINFDVTPEEQDHIDAILDRMDDLDVLDDRLSALMDLRACHATDVPLDLERLLNEFDDYNFLHDVVGIKRHMNRETGKLMDCFLPRCARPSPRVA